LSDVIAKNHPQMKIKNLKKKRFALGFWISKISINFKDMMFATMHNILM
jgi:hypothetical protein